MSTETLAEWLIAEEIMPAEGPGAIADAAGVRDLMIAFAKRREPISYSELLQALGHRFTRPKMRAVCKTLDAIDREAAQTGEPALAVLVVRESDRLPGQGWWTGAAETRGYQGSWTGPEAAAFVARLQQRAFDHWAARKG